MIKNNTNKISYAQAATRVEVTKKMDETDKINLVAFTTELVITVLQKANIANISRSNIIASAVPLALKHFQLTIEGEKLHNIISKPNPRETSDSLEPPPPSVNG